MLRRKNFSEWLEDKGLDKQVARDRGLFAAVHNQAKSQGKIKDWKKADWQGPMLKELPIKRYGRSYKDKFNNVAQEAGVPKEDMDGFKEWLGNRGQGSTPAYFQHGLNDVIKGAKAAQNKAKKDQKRYEKSITYNQEAIREREEREAAKKREKEKEAKKKEKASKPSVLDSLMKGFKDSAKSTLEGEYTEEGAFKKDENAKSILEKPKGLDRFEYQAVNASTLGLVDNAMRRNLKSGNMTEEEAARYERNLGAAEGGGQVASDVLANLIGYMAPGIGAVKGARALGIGAKGLGQGSLKRQAAQLAKEGSLVGGALAGGEIAAREALNPEDYNWQDNLTHLGINVAAGAALDPLIGLAGPVARQVSGNMAENAVNRAAMNQLDSAVRSGDYEPLAPLRQPDGRTSYSPLPSMDELMPNRMGSSFDSTNVIEQVTRGPQAPQRARMQVPPQQARIAPDAPLGERVAHYANPETRVTPEDRNAIVTTINETNARIEEFMNRNYDQLREMELQKDSKLQSEYNAARAYMNHASGFNERWSAIKEVQEQFARPKDRPQWAKFSLPKGYTQMDEFKGLPRMFIDQKSSVGFDNAMEMAGFNDWESFKDHLSTIYDTLKTQKKDIMNTAYYTPEKEAAYTKLIEDTDSAIEQRLMESTGIGRAREQVAQMESALNRLADAPEVVEPPASRTFTAQRNVIDDLLARRAPESSVSSDAPATSQDASQSLPEGFGNQSPMGAMAGRIDPYEATPIANTQSRLENLKERIGTPKSAWDNIRVNWDSSLHPAKQLEKQVVNVLRTSQKDLLDSEFIKLLPDGKNLSIADSFAKSVQSLPKSTAIAVRSYEKGYEPVFRTLKKNKIPREIFEQYAVAKHARDIYAKNADKAARYGELADELELIEANRAENRDPGMRKALDDRERELLKEMDTLDQYKLPKIATEEWTEHILNQFDNIPAMREAHDLFIKEQRKDLEALYENGIHTREQVDAMIEAHPNYVSMKRKVPGEERRARTGNMINLKTPIQRRGSGSEEWDILSPFDTAFENRLSSVSVSAKNKAIQALSKWDKIGDLDTVIQRVDPNELDFEKHAKHVIKGYENGKEVYYQVPPVIKEMLENAPSGVKDDIGMNILKGAANIFKKGTTNWNPSFHMYSAVRDSTQALAVSRTGAHMGDTIMGFLDSFMGPQLSKATGGLFKSYREVYKDLGGDLSGFISQDQYSMRKLTEAMRKGNMSGMRLLNPINHIEEFGRRMEHGARLGEFRSAKKKGYSDADASFEATDIIDYTDQGRMTRKLNPYDPYLSATIRGNNRTFQAFKNNPKQFVKVGLTYVTLPTLANYAMRFSETTSDVQRDRINNLPTWQKNLVWAIPVPNSKTDEVLLMPKPFILGQAFANPIERALDKVYTDTDKPSGQIAKDAGLDVFQTLMPPTTLIGFTSAYEVMANKDFFTGMPIEDMAMQNQEDKTERYNAYTSEVAKKAGDATKQSPAMLDHLLKKHTGTLGRQGLDVLDNVLAKDGSRPAKVNTSARIANPFSRFLHNETSASGLYNEIYKQSEKDDKAWREANPDKLRMPKKDRPKTKAQKAYEQMKELNDEIKDIRESTEYTAKQKQDMIGKLRDKQKRIGTNYMQE